jgi:hypothetical protein
MFQHYSFMWHFLNPHYVLDNLLDSWNIAVNQKNKQTKKTQKKTNLPSINYIF